MTFADALGEQADLAERDELRCAFVDATGRRCTEKSFLELHHRHPFARDGEHSHANVSLLCRPHNQHFAELDFGSSFIEQKRRKAVHPPPI